jgi:hypothetical protein
MAKGAKNLMRAGKPHKNQDEHASKNGMGFGTSNPDKSAMRRIKVAKGLLIKK